MDVLGLTATQESLWWVTLGLGLIVLLAVAAFLTLLVTLVGTIEKRVDLIPPRRLIKRNPTRPIRH